MQPSDKLTAKPLRPLVNGLTGIAPALADVDRKLMAQLHDELEISVTYLIEQLVDGVSIFPDHLEVTVTGAPPLNVLYQEVGLKESGFVGVGGPSRTFRTLAMLKGKVLLRAA